MSVNNISPFNKRLIAEGMMKEQEKMNDVYFEVSRMRYSSEATYNCYNYNAGFYYETWTKTSYDISSCIR